MFSKHVFEMFLENIFENIFGRYYLKIFLENIFWKYFSRNDLEQYACSVSLLCSSLSSVMLHAQSLPSSMFPWASVMQLPVHDVVDLGL